MNYPTKQEIENANQKQLCYWWRYLPSPGFNSIGNVHLSTKEVEKIREKEFKLLDLICKKYIEGGSMSPEMSKEIDKMHKEIHRL